MPGIQVFFIHPDDETACSGLLVKLAQKGVPVHLVVGTRGEGSGKPRPGLTVGQTREAEMKDSAAAIGAASLEFMGLVDKPWDGKGQAPDHDPESIRMQIVSMIKKIEPDIVLSHGSSGEYHHQGHIMMHVRVKEAVRTMGGAAPPLYSFRAWNPEKALPYQAGTGNRNDPADFIVDVTAYIEKMQEVIRCHSSQELSKKVLKPPHYECYHRQWPEVHGKPQDVMKHWCERK